MSIFVITIAGLLGPAFGITREPVIPQVWTQSVRARCDRQSIEISGYGASDKRRRPANVTINGRRLTGDGADKLYADLSVRSAVYRITILCGQDGIVTMRLYRGAARNGAVEYYAANANIKNGHLIDYTGLQPTEVEGFWFS